MVYRCILPAWLADERPDLRRVKEGEFTQPQVDALNAQGYNIYWLPNGPKIYDPSQTVDGSHIDDFRYVFVDMDLKDGTYETKAAFIQAVCDVGPPPSMIIDSGNGVHVYWAVSDLDAHSYLRLSRRLMRQFITDEAVGQIYQLMRVPGTLNTKAKGNYKPCTLVYEDIATYTCEQLDKQLPKITLADEAYCQQHFDKTYQISGPIEISDKIPMKFNRLLRANAEVKEIWTGNVEDRSAGDFRLGHLMFAGGLSKDEAMSVLVNTAKALERAPKHRVNYAINIVDKIWTYESTIDKSSLDLSMTVREILDKGGDTLKGTRFPCWRYLDATLHGFRLGQIIGLVAGSGVGKTAMALNMFEGFVQNNPDYDHFFVPLEQPANEIADRWKTMCRGKTHLYDKVHVLSNYDADGGFRHLSFDDIREYILKYQNVTGRKVGCVVIDHIGALKKKGKNGENQDLMDICHQMKAFAVETNTMLVMQSQAPREKAGIGDLELNKDAAYGTVFFESYVDYLVTIWQPLKRCYGVTIGGTPCPTVTAYKFCKIRHKKQGQDEIQEDKCYRLFFEPETEHLRLLTQTEETAFDFYNKDATNKRKQDRKTDVVSYTSVRWDQQGVTDAEANHHQDPFRTKRTARVS